MKIPTENPQGVWLTAIRHLFRSSAVALLAALLPCALTAGPIVIRINDVPNGRPVVQVQGAPNGYNLYTGELVANPAIEHGGLITLIGVDQAGSIPEWAGRFVVPVAPLWFRTAVDIVWVTHDIEGPFGNGDLQVGFNSAFPGTYYFNPGLVAPDGTVINTDENLGLVTDNWVKVYADDTLVVLFKPHTYRLTVPRDISGAMDGWFTVEPDPAAPPGSYGIRSHFDVVGNPSHLGASRMHVEHTPWPDAEGTVTDGQFTITAANGDQISGVYEGTTDLSNPALLVGHATFVITGGTGRFADASGALEATAFVTALGPPGPDIVWPVTWVLEGTVNY